MELNQLKTFVAVAEEGHLTRAAERLYTSQPAVSAQLKALEGQLGVQLFERTPKGMRLTPFGDALLEQAKQTIASAGAMLSQAKSLQGQVMGELRIGLNSDITFLRLPELLAYSRSQFPGIRIALRNSMSADIIRDIRKGKLDSGFFFGPCRYGDLHITHLADIPTAIVAPRAWQAKIAHADLATLAQQAWIYTTEECPFYVLKETLFESSERKPAKAVFVDTEESIRALIKAEAGISLLREDDAEQAEQEGWGIRWPGPTPHCPLSTAVQRHRSSEPVIQAWQQSLASSWDLNQDKPAREVI